MKKKYVSLSVEFDSFTLEYNICATYGDTDDPELYAAGQGTPSIIQTAPTLPSDWDPWG